jgi:hypothetical protein
MAATKNSGGFLLSARRYDYSVSAAEPEDPTLFNATVFITGAFVENSKVLSLS